MAMDGHHGNTWAAWATVGVMFLGVLIASIGMMTFSSTVTWIGAALVPLGLLVGFAMSKMGYGASRG
ncbi:MAG TPA: HGxxPAAW family protein [Marmoricola sp.]|nr:HGxxPAAW family protein [Marmoricola sp.]